MRDAILEGGAAIQWNPKALADADDSDGRVAHSASPNLGLSRWKTRNPRPNMTRTTVMGTITSPPRTLADHGISGLTSDRRMSSMIWAMGLKATKKRNRGGM